MESRSLIDVTVYPSPGRTFVWRRTSTAMGAMWTQVSKRLASLLTFRALVVDIDDAADPDRPITTVFAPGARRSSESSGAVELSTLDAEALCSWLAENTPSTATVPSIALEQAVFAMDVPDGTTLAVKGRGNVQVHGGAFDPLAVVIPTEQPLAVRLADDGKLTISILWSPWFEPGGVSAAAFNALVGGLADDGWQLQHHPPDWRAPGSSAFIERTSAAPSRRADGPRVAWCALPATMVRIGISERERARLAEVLVEVERADREAEGSLGFDGFDRDRRRREIVEGLELAVGASEEGVAAGEIMQHPVTNAQWEQFMAATGAARPASWGAGRAALDEFVTGVSWHEAEAFARHHGWSLPTEGEWQLAATGDSARWFPWGDDFAPLGAALDRGNVPWRVGQAPSLASPLGVEDLLGAFCEYTTAWLRPLAGGDALAFVRRADSGEQRVARGVAPRVPSCIAARRGVAPDHRFKLARFRCVRR